MFEIHMFVRCNGNSTLRNFNLDFMRNTCKYLKLYLKVFVYVYVFVFEFQVFVFVLRHVFKPISA